MERIIILAAILIIIVISIIISSNLVSVFPKGGKCSENSLVVAKGDKIAIEVMMLKGEYFLDFYYYWDEPANRINLEKGWANAYGTTIAPHRIGVHKLVIVRGLFEEKYEYYYEIAD